MEVLIQKFLSGGRVSYAKTYHEAINVVIIIITY
jgi:hypothetical protein